MSPDSLAHHDVDEIGRRHPYVDTAVVHLGGTRVLLHTVTMDAAQGVDFLRRVRPGRAVPVHHDDYGVFRFPLADFLDLAAQHGLRDRVRTVARGETVPLPVE